MEVKVSNVEMGLNSLCATLMLAWTVVFAVDVDENVKIVS